MAVLSISRQFGAGGKTTAERVAGRLNYRYADSELVGRVARELGLSDEWVDTQGREVGYGAARGFGLSSSNFLARLIGQKQSDFTEDRLVELFRRIIPEMALDGDIVFLGRASQFLLPGAPSVVKVLMVAALEDRVRFMMKAYQLDEKEARRVVADWEENRSKFLSRFTFSDHNDPGVYTMVVNTSLVSLDQAEDMIVDLVQSRDAVAQ